MDIPIEAKVQCTDGRCGKSTAVIVNPVKEEVTHFVVKYKELPENPDRLVPVEKITEISGGLIHLSCTKAELAEMPPFTTTGYVETKIPDPRYATGPGIYDQPQVVYETESVPVAVEHVPPGELAVYRGMAVTTGEGKVGTVDELVVDPDSGNITHLLMLKGHVWGKKDVAIPVTAIDRVYADGVYLKMDKEAIKALPTVPVKRH